MPGANSPYTLLDYNQVIQRVFDEQQDRLRTDAQVSVTVDAELAVEIDAASGDNIALANEDGSKKVTVTTVGSKEALDVNIVSSIGDITVTNIYNEVLAVASGVLTTVATYTAVIEKRIAKIAVSGSNIAKYQVLINSTVVDQKRTGFTELNSECNFNDGLKLSPGQTVYVKVIHNRPDVGDFNARIQLED